MRVGYIAQNLYGTGGEEIDDLSPVSAGIRVRGISMREKKLTLPCVEEAKLKMDVLNGPATNK